jgi:hypothetical protein
MAPLGRVDADGTRKPSTETENLARQPFAIRFSHERASEPEGGVMMRRITAVAALELPCPPETALPAIWDIQSIERTERKADWVQVHPTSARTGSYDVRGRFAGVRWAGRFEYELDERGFHSRSADVPRGDATVEGGFVLTPLGEDRSTVIHYEQYVLAPWLVPLAALMLCYLRWSMRRELRELRSLILAGASSCG